MINRERRSTGTMSRGAKWEPATGNRTKFLEKWRLGSAICVPYFVENGAQELELCAILCLVRRRGRKYEENSPSFRVLYLRNG